MERSRGMLTYYPKAIVTKDGTPVLLRPLKPDDEARLRAFFSRIPREELWFRREDVQDPQVIRQWIERLNCDRVLSMVAVKETDGAIIANLSLHRRPFGCLSHIGHIRILVDPAHRSQRLGTWMLLDMVKMAADMGVEKLVSEFVAGVEEAAILAAQKMDFFKEAVLHDYVKDLAGKLHDLIIMIKTLHREWSDF
jgi:GNAT superfamily N-acetyltransferase